MRLTLRTLLAYLDDILDPSDAEELGKKIEESEFATGLVHRIRSSMRRLRLGVPSLHGKGMGLDPNTVAEYLDNVLPADRVPDLEKVCLESDVHLAEVASCHQILTLVLGEPADFDPELRYQMYRIGNPDWDAQQSAGADTEESPHESRDRAHGSDSPAPETSEVEAPPAPTEPPVQTVSARKARSVQVPEYLRAGQRSKAKPILITLALTFLLSAVALRAMGPFDRRHPLVRLFGGGAVAQVPQTATEQPRAASGTVSDRAGTPQEQAEMPAPVHGGVTVSDEPGASDSTQTGGNETPEHAEPQPASTGGGTPAPGDRTETGKGDVSGEQSPAPGADTAPPAEPADAGGAELPSPAEPAPPIEESAASKAPTAGMEVSPEPSGPPAPTSVGYVKLSDQHFLVRFDPDSGAWLRLAARSKLVAGDELRVLPTYRPEIVLTPGVQVLVVGPASIRPLAHGDQGQPGLFIEFGRALIATAGVAGATIDLDLGGQRGLARFADATSELAVEVYRYLPPGANPERDPGQTMVRMFTTVGRVEWQHQGAPAPVPIDAGQVRILTGDTAQTAAATQLPVWIQRDDVREVDRVASATLEPALVMDRPITLSLREKTVDRRSEVRSLAARCLAYLDSFDALIAEFNNDKQRSYWSSEFDVLHHLICRSPESASRVREALERLCGEVAADLYRLAWGYSPQQLQEGADAQLVEYLDHESLNVRVFAAEVLRRITGKTHGFRPENPQMRRRSAVQDWREDLEKGKILYNIYPTPSPEG